MLHFIYRDSFIEDEETTKSDSPESSPSGRMAAKLLAAADKYGLERLRLLCEAHLCKDLCVDSVANTLSLADHYHATELKAACLKYVAENLGGTYHLLLGFFILFINRLLNKYILMLYSISL